MTTRIGYLVPQFPGQTHSFFWREIEAMRAAGADVSLISTRPPNAGRMPHRWAEAAAAETFYLSSNSLTAASDLGPLGSALWRIAPLLRAASRSDGARLLALLPAAVALKKHAQALDLSHLHLGSSGKAATVAALSRYLGGPRYSLTLHNPIRVFGPLQSINWGQASFGAAITTAVLDDLQERYGPHLPSTMIVQPMGVNTETFARTAPYDPWRGTGPFRIFCCARLNGAKGHTDLIAATSALRDAGIPATLAIAGEDDKGGKGYRRVLEAAIAASGLGEVVTLLGAVSEETVRQHNADAHAFALASFEEPLGVAYMEAMSLGVPTIGTNAGGVPSLITHGVDGLLVPPRSPQALASALAEVAQDPDLAIRMSGAARARAVSSFDADRGAVRILAEISRLAGEARRSAIVADDQKTDFSFAGTPNDGELA